MVPCSFCGKSIPCPPSMANKDKHSCFECFKQHAESWSQQDINQVHVAFPIDKIGDAIPEVMTDFLVKETFPGLWKERKEELKILQRRDLAQEMFGAGAYSALRMMKDMHEEMGSNGDDREEVDPGSGGVS